MRHAPLLTALAIVTLAGCQQQTTTTVAPDEGAGVNATASATGPMPTSTVPPVASASPFASLEPEVMALADWKGAKLDGELGCGFSRDGADGPLLFAASDVDKTMTSDAAIRLGGKVYKLVTQSKGGFDALTTGARFAGPDGLVANVVRSGERVRETPAIAEESPRYPAQLVISQGGREMGVGGFWECGP